MTAPEVNSLSMAQAGLTSSFTMSLTQGWDLIPSEQGGRSLMAGDGIMLHVASPEGPVSCPPGWAQPVDHWFFRVINQPAQEIAPTFHAAADSSEWAVYGYALTGVAVASDSSWMATVTGETAVFP